MQGGGAVYVVSPNAEIAPPADLDLSVHASAAAALRAHQGKRPPALGSVRLPDTEFHRDAALRREGWAAYLAFLRETLREGAA